MSDLHIALDRLDTILDDLNARLDNGARLAAAAVVLARQDDLAATLRTMAEAAAAACRAPFGGVTLVDDSYTTLLACTAGSDYGEGRPREESFCQVVAGTGRSFMVQDSALNPFARHLPPATNPAWPVRAYYGSPIYSPDGWPLGSFCIADTQPRRWRTAELLLVDAYAAQVTEMLREP